MFSEILLIIWSVLFFKCAVLYSLFNYLFYSSFILFLLPFPSPLFSISFPPVSFSPSFPFHFSSFFQFSIFNYLYPFSVPSFPLIFILIVPPFPVFPSPSIPYLLPFFLFLFSFPVLNCLSPLFPFKVYF